jgi:hypothetical protein
MKYLKQDTLACLSSLAVQNSPLSNVARRWVISETSKISLDSFSELTFRSISTGDQREVSTFASFFKLAFL